VTTLHFVLPDGIDDPRRPSGGNVYGRRVIQGLAGLGWTVHERRVDELTRIPDGELVLVDGLVASDEVVRETARLRVVVLVHMPIGRAPLEAAAAVVATSRWTREWLLGTCALPEGRVHVVEPGVDVAPISNGTPAGRELLCVGAVVEAKGHDLLLEALAKLHDLDWRCVCVGALDLEPDFVDRLPSLGGRVVRTGPLTGADLDTAYAGADVLVSASRAETYGMVVTEALVRGLPVIATDVGGVREAIGRPDAGVLVAPDDSLALAGALRCWLTDAAQRDRLRSGARRRREGLTDWQHTSRRLADVLADVT
jgi:glycosyltransferase involved in cell wall biosynthesis